MSSDTPTPQLPPEVLRYLKGPTSESRQFDFLIGEWEVEATRAASGALEHTSGGALRRVPVTSNGKGGMRSVLTIGALLVSVFAVGCEDAQALKAAEARQQLVGTWLREINIPNAKARRVLVLAQDGKFSEELVAEFDDGRKGHEERSGEWNFDGTNLKRRYTHEDGRQLSGNFNFVTFELSSLSASEFEGRNHLQGEQIHYRRVTPGTRP
jgi:hypothetical protein